MELTAKRPTKKRVFGKGGGTGVWSSYGVGMYGVHLSTMPDQETMSIAQALSEIHAATDATRPFLIRFVRSTGRKIGSIKTIPAAVKGFPQNTHGQAAGGKRKEPEARVLYKEAGIVPVVDLHTGRLNTILISHIVQYNQYKIIH